MTCNDASNSPCAALKPSFKEAVAGLTEHWSISSFNQAKFLLKDLLRFLIKEDKGIKAISSPSSNAPRISEVNFLALENLLPSSSVISMLNELSKTMIILDFA